MYVCMYGSKHGNLIWRNEESRKKRNKLNLINLLMKIIVKRFRLDHLLQDFKIHRCLNNIFHDFKVLKKVIKSETFNDD